MHSAYLAHGFGACIHEMLRTLGIALALVNAKDGLLLIDEFENGLYYTIQPDIWKLIFRIARRLNIQVFATTHSWDCIEAFQVAASSIAEQQNEGLLIRLELIHNTIVPTLFDERELSIAAREHIEVR
jgi:AAA15 family ATPase/GTPase